MVSKTSAQNIDVAERRSFVLAQRKAGYNYRQIAALTVAKFGAENLPKDYAERYAHKDVQAELDRLRADTQEDAANLVRLEVERLDVALKAIAPKVQRGNMAAIDRWIRLSETRRKLLGLDEPTKQEHRGTGKDGAIVLALTGLESLTDDEIDSLIED